MLKGIKVKIYPNQEQIQFIEQNIGNARFVWNQMLDMWSARYQNNPNLPTLGKYDLNGLLPSSSLIKNMLILLFAFFWLDNPSVEHTIFCMVSCFFSFFFGVIATS